MKQVLYRKANFGSLEGEVFACIPYYDGGANIKIFNECGPGYMALEFFTDCTEDATTEESAKLRAMLADMGQQPEEITFNEFMRIIFPERENAESKRDAYSAGSPEANFSLYYGDLEKLIIKDGYTPKTTMENLVSMVILHFDSADNYGEYDPESGFVGYGDEFTLDECVRYVSESGGWAEFDYYC